MSLKQLTQHQLDLRIFFYLITRHSQKYSLTFQWKIVRRVYNFISDKYIISVQRMWDLMEIGKRIIQLLKISYCPYFHDRRHFCTLERNAVVTQHLTPRPRATFHQVVIMQMIFSFESWHFSKCNTLLKGINSVAYFIVVSDQTQLNRVSGNMYFTYLTVCVFCFQRIPFSEFIRPTL